MFINYINYDICGPTVFEGSVVGIIIFQLQMQRKLVEQKSQQPTLDFKAWLSRALRPLGAMKNVGAVAGRWIFLPRIFHDL